MNFRNKKVLVVGFGISGQAAARFLLRRRAKVAVTDIGAPTHTPSFGPLECHWDGHPPEIFKDRDLIVVSPGVPLDLPGLLLARRRRIPILGEFGLASEFLRGPIIAVTGTNGKSTTVTLIAKILEKSGKRIALAGNIGRPLIEVVMENKKRDWIVAEVSSYQLETVRKFHPRISVLLNITEDHLDRYRSFRDYARAKMRIFREQTSRDVLIYKEDDPVVKMGVRRARARKIGFSLSAPATVYRIGNTIVFDNETYPLNRTQLVGFHNMENMMASIAAARLAGASSTAVQKTLEEFVGLPHRTELVRKVRGVHYFDDSKGTNVDAAVKSLAGFPDRKVILIAGGRDKGGNYEPLREMAEKKVKLMILIGEAREKIDGEMGRQREGERIKVETLQEAVPLAASRAEAGDIVLLSPACSSFDQFRDYKERGEIFQRLVKRL